MNVLVIPEDFRKDQYILKPVIEAMFAAVGKPRARVVVCKDPLLSGIEQALRWEKIAEILDRYRGMIQRFILVVDRDGHAERRERLERLERRAAAYLGSTATFLAENAWQEIEVWALAAQSLPARWRWRAVREEPNPKERYFLPFVVQRRLLDEPGQGRRTLGLEAGARYQRVRELCKEDVEHLERRLGSA